MKNKIFQFMQNFWKIKLELCEGQWEKVYLKLIKKLIMRYMKTLSLQPFLKKLAVFLSLTAAGSWVAWDSSSVFLCNTSPQEERLPRGFSITDCGSRDLENTLTGTGLHKVSSMLAFGRLVTSLNPHPKYSKSPRNEGKTGGPQCTHSLNPLAPYTS